MTDPNLLPLDVSRASFDTLGSIIIALQIGHVLFGLLVYQVHYYFKMYPGDRLWIKIFVSVVMITQLLHNVLWVIASYHYGITDPYTTAALSHAHWSLRLLILVTVRLACPYQNQTRR
ncbi:hypothetical protein C8Q73DRAFT_360680 [Cubamyces lactineus]|nr:hypothetical protein C8Q73DRAFT_360680 [Cubamyces lactineus]